MKRTLSVLLLLGLILWSFALQAGIYMEPLIGYGSGSHSQKAAGKTVSGATTEGVVGGILGISVGGIFLGAEALAGRGTYTRDATLLKPKLASAQNFTDVSGILGMHFAGLPLRMWGGYSLEHKLYVDNLGHFEGNGFKVGIGYRIFNATYINVEYGMYTFSVFQDEIQPYRFTLPYILLGDTYDKKTINQFIVSLSFPMTLFGSK
ncbi:MAG: hypothetical protein HQK52_21490 [Oligoflexia bacterium]|nr:hypothetical protein [Oligoflexia bacterium]